MKKSIVLFLLFLFLSTPGVYATDPIHKLGRGVANIFTGAFEIVNETIIGARDQNIFVAPFRGLVFGTAKGLYRIGIGGIETFTFFIPVPRGFAPIIEPENALDTLKELTDEMKPEEAPEEGAAVEEAPTIEERAAEREEKLGAAIEREMDRRS